MTEIITKTQPMSDEGPRSNGWWGDYSGRLTSSPLSKTACDVIAADSAYIVDRGVLPAGGSLWPESRTRRGIVMGAVQSGKTASMLGVAARSLDGPADMVVVLAGTRVTLWRQTLDRLLDQLDGFESDAASEMAQKRVFIPDPVWVTTGADERRPEQLYEIGRSKARRAVSENRPIIAVVMKNVDHLRAMSRVIHKSIVPVVDSGTRPFHLVILDDESDDGSILDARAEAGRDPAIDELKQIPRAIVDLWETRPRSGSTASSNLYATYIGYTATPQANFLQSDHNPLAPRDFVFSLRTPFDHGKLGPRSTTYLEPKGLDAYYTGGEAFYDRVGSQVLCVPTSEDAGKNIADAVRSFLVAGAIRIWREPDRQRPTQANERPFGSAAEARANSPKPHSMLVHPSAAISEHFDAAASILEAVCGLNRATSEDLIQAGERGLPVEALTESTVNSSSVWTKWIDSYRKSAATLEGAFGLADARRVPALSDWDEIRSILLKEVIPYTQIKVVNSDPEADDRPHFDPIETSPGEWRPAPDSSTIFVSGNVMSRGLTLEGLTTTLFLRNAKDPFADTQMQMQRWFGYRGSFLELCRVFLPKSQFALFREYHDTDEALRRTVISAMNRGDDAPSPFVIQGMDFAATGKLTNVENVPLCPGATPFIRLVNDGRQGDPNLALIARTFRAGPSRDLVVGRLSRGRILDVPLSLTGAADLLDQLRYDHHVPTSDGWEGRRWIDLESKVGIDPKTDPGHLLPFFRPPVAGESTPVTPYSRGGPHAIGAYLRLWKACLTRRARGLVPTDDGQTPWRMLNLERRRALQPHFYVGIRYGSGSNITDESVANLPFQIRAMKRTATSDGRLTAQWGSRNPSAVEGAYLGDQLFDYHLHDHTPPEVEPGEPVWRPMGAPGLILFHVTKHDEAEFATVAVGVALPLGGPDQFAARKPGER